MAKHKVIVVLACMGLFEACTWVKPIEEAREIALVKPELAQHCKKLSTVTVKVADKVGFIQRKGSKVEDELITMAKNEAALVSGDIIVAESEASEGRQRFGVYDCD